MDAAAALPAPVVVDDERTRALAELLHACARRRGLAVPFDRFHDVVPPRAVVAWIDRMAADLRTAEARAILDEIALSIARTHLRGDAFVVQTAPCVRVRPPRRPDLATPFHTDAGAGNPAEQLGIWIPLVDVDSAASMSIGADAEHSAPVRLRVGQLLVFDAHTPHGAPAHDVDTTRVSVDLRVAPATAHRGRFAWHARPLSPRSDCGGGPPRPLSPR